MQSISNNLPIHVLQPNFWSLWDSTNQNLLNCTRQQKCTWSEVKIIKILLPIHLMLSACCKYCTIYLFRHYSDIHVFISSGSSAMWWDCMCWDDHAPVGEEAVGGEWLSMGPSLCSWPFRVSGAWPVESASIIRCCAACWAPMARTVACCWADMALNSLALATASSFTSLLKGCSRMVVAALAFAVAPSTISRAPDVTFTKSSLAFAFFSIFPASLGLIITSSWPFPALAILTPNNSFTIPSPIRAPVPHNLRRWASKLGWSSLPPILSNSWHPVKRGLQFGSTSTASKSSNILHNLRRWASKLCELLFLWTWRYSELVSGTATLNSVGFWPGTCKKKWLSTNKSFTRSKLLLYSCKSGYLLPLQICHYYCNNDATIDRERLMRCFEQGMNFPSLFDVGFVQELGFDKWLSSVLTLGPVLIKLHTAVVSHTPPTWHL